ncbi:YktB family protein [Shouchella shacheensis]|uniref:YktB family protein n=1 Tax=Shouchella shacheensis TaxID=1649580 RepID=UPI00073FC3DB|nr:DUF1054 domain-containing protein [Shouchella shacheensis]
MAFNGFTEHDFETFSIDGLEERMEAIRERIQPKFKDIGDELVNELTSMTGSEMYLHIAQHARRTKNPPKDTWLAVAANKRGYKQHPHFQVGLFEDHVFIWLAFIYELPGKQEMASTFISEVETLREVIPDDYVVSLDHTKKDSTPFSDLNLDASLERFRDVKKCEWLVGQHIKRNDPLLSDGEAFMSTVKETVETLLPIYKLAYK